MPDLATLLRRSAPPAPPVDLDEIRRRVDSRRSRRRRATAGIAALVVAVVGVVAWPERKMATDSHLVSVPDPVDESKATEEQEGAELEIAPQRVASEATAVAGADGMLWALAPAAPGKTAVHRLDPTTGAVTQTSEVVGSATFLAVGAGMVLVGDAGDTTDPDGHLSLVVPETGSIPLRAEVIGGSPHAAAFRGDTAWVTTGTGGRVLRITRDKAGFRQTAVEVGGETTDIVVLDTGYVWVRDQAGKRFVRLDADTLREVEVVPWDGRLLATMEGSLVWVTEPLTWDVDNSRDTILISLADGAHRTTFTLKTALVDPEMSITPDAIWLFADGGIERWSRRLHPATPTAAIPGPGATTLAIVGDTAWFVANGGEGLWRWQPQVAPDPGPRPIEAGFRPMGAPESNGLPAEVNRLLGTCVEGDPKGLREGNIADVVDGVPGDLGARFTEHGGNFRWAGGAWNGGRCADMKGYLRLEYGELIP